MGLLSCFKNIIENARGVEPIQEAHVIHEDKKEPTECKEFGDEKFYKLRSILDLHIVEYEAIIREIDNALKGLHYEECISFNWADPDLTLNYPNVELYGEMTPMTEFRLLLLEWIDYRIHNKNAL